VVIDVDAHSTVVPARDRLLPGIHIHEKVNLNGLASGYDTLALLAAYRGRPDPVTDESTLRVKTPSGGLHIWYRTTEAFRSSTGSSPKVALAWQVDIRAHGGYIVAPMTTTPKGPYLPAGEVRHPAPLPDWLEAELTRTGHRVTPSRTTGEESPQRTPHPRRPAPGATRTLLPLLAEVSACSAVPEGAGFTEKLNRAGYTAGGLVAAGHLHDSEAVALLRQAAAAARPAQPGRNARIIADALAAGSRRPLHLKGRS
jgi:hypothetical protein